MKTLIIATLLLVSSLAFAQLEERRHQMQYRNVPLDIVLEEYAELSGKQVEVADGVRAAISLQTTNLVTLAEALGLIEAELKKQNIGLFTTPGDKVIAKWIDPKRKKSEKGLSDRKRDSEHLTEEQLRQRQMEIIRAGGKLGPPLPIPLTKEMDAQLVNEGVLPPLKKTDESAETKEPLTFDFPKTWPRNLLEVGMPAFEVPNVLAVQGISQGRMGIRSLGRSSKRNYKLSSGYSLRITYSSGTYRGSNVVRTVRSISILDEIDAPIWEGKRLKLKSDDNMATEITAVDTNNVARIFVHSPIPTVLITSPSPTH